MVVMKLQYRMLTEIKKKKIEKEDYFSYEIMISKK
ncbi:MAG: hypothetical protein Pg6B_00420 [Candidatus Azobacteroides pseudotrichonymphae]|nr:MAG: hypothetical protein Pg6B_00420 [Candidatus Azobacteroides pseudotrichonymphae]